MVNSASSSVMYFRRDLIKSLRRLGHKIVLITADSDFQEEIQQLCDKRYVINVHNRSTNVFKSIYYFNRVRAITRAEKPDVVFTFQAKPNTLGVLGAKKYCSNIYSMIEGLGDVFIKETVTWRIVRKILRLMYRISLKKANKVFFLNSDDKDYFLNNRLVKTNQIVQIDGIGINLDSFPFKEVSNFNTILMVARLLKSKGVIEYCEAAKIVKNQGYQYNFILIGSESELSSRDIKEYTDFNYITYLGFQKNVKSIIEESTIFVLPSYREGLPISTLEAMAIGRPIITTNAVGCKDTIIDAYNGFVVAIGDANDIADKVIKLMSDRDKIIHYGKNGRKMTEDKFNQININKKITDIILEKTN